VRRLTQGPNGRLRFVASAVFVIVIVIVGNLAVRRPTAPLLPAVVDDLALEHLHDAPAAGAVSRCRIGGKDATRTSLERDGHRLSLFSMRDPTPAGSGCVDALGVRVCAAADPLGGTRALVGDLPEAQMLGIVDESLR
jgi:hypothetical protein